MTSAKTSSWTSVDLAADEREQRCAFEPVGAVDPGDLADRGVEVELAHERVVHLTAGEAAGPAHQEQHADATVVHRGLGVGERETVVGRQDHERVRPTRPFSSSALSTVPTPWSSDRALALNDAMSRRVRGVSTMFSGGRE